MKCSPQYREERASHRIAYVANGRWQLQAYHGDGEPDNYADPWKPVNAPTTYEDARRQLGQFA